MTPFRLAGLATATALLAGPAPAQSSPFPAAMAEAGRTLQTAVVQYLLLAARSGVELTYDGVSVDPRTQDVVVDGLVLHPRLDWDREGACVIEIDRVALPGATSASIERLELIAEIDGMRMPPECLEPAAGLTLQSFGYDMLEVESAGLTLSYHLPSSGADLFVTAAVAEAATITLDAEFDYLWVSGLAPEDEDAEPEPEPVAHLSSAELTVENAGLWERLSPLLGQQLGDVEAIPPMLRALLTQALAGEGGQPGPEARAFIDNAVEEVARFTREGDRLVLTVAPEDGVWLGPDLFQTPATVLAALQPRVSAAPRSVGRMIAPERLSAALAEGAQVAQAERLAVGRALMTGVGAPLAPEQGAALVAPLAEDWDAEAAMLLAESRAETGDPAGAYAMALRARAGGAPGSAALLARLEGRVGVGELIGAQESALSAWPGRPDWVAARDAAEQEGDIAALRRMAARAETGRHMPRSYTQAYYLASLAAAAGNRTAASLRDRIDARFAGPDGGAVAGWAEAREAAADAALTAWTEGGLAARVAERYGLAE